MKTHIRRQQHNFFFKHQDIKQKEPPQKYRLGTISNTKILAGLNRFHRRLTSPSASYATGGELKDYKQGKAKNFTFLSYEIFTPTPAKIAISTLYG